MIQERFENITLAYQRSIGPYGQHNRHFMENFKQTLDREQLLDDQPGRSHPCGGRKAPI